MWSRRELERYLDAFEWEWTPGVLRQKAVAFRLAVGAGAYERLGGYPENYAPALMEPELLRLAAEHIEDSALALERDSEEIDKAARELDKLAARLVDPEDVALSEPKRHVAWLYERWIHNRDELECAIDAMRYRVSRSPEIKDTLLKAMEKLDKVDSKVRQSKWLFLAASYCDEGRRKLEKSGATLSPRDHWWWFVLPVDRGGKAEGGDERR